MCEGAAYCPPKGFLLQSFHKRSCKTTPRPAGYSTLEHNRVDWATRAAPADGRVWCYTSAGYAAALRAAKRLGAALGVHYRVDMYLTPDGVPVLGEFTPWGLLGAAHCVIRHSHHGMLDACTLGRLWAKHGQVEGGTNDSATPPPGFLAAIDLRDQPTRLCRLLMHRQAAGGGSTSQRKQRGPAGRAGSVGWGESPPFAVFAKGIGAVRVNV